VSRTIVLRRFARRLPEAVTDHLPFWALAASALGIAFPSAAQRGADAVPVLLGVMVFAMGFTISPLRLAAVLGRPGRVILLLALQYGPLSLLAYLLSRLPLPQPVSAGILVLGVCPCEISSGVMVMLAGGDAALGTMTVAASLLAGTLLTPWLLTQYAHGAVVVDRGALTRELMLSVGLPLIAAVSLRGWLMLQRAQAWLMTSFTFWDDPASLARRRTAPGFVLRTADRLLPAVAALAVLALLFIVAGSTRSVLLSADAAVALALCLALNLAGYAAGWLLFRLRRAPELAVRAAVFTSGMREFGVAAAVATSALPAAVPVAGLYGILILLTAPLLVRAYRGHR
jgi:BASS family bile acid:Na+ symporter